MTKKEKAELIRANRGLTPYLAKKYFGAFPFYGLSVEDMFQLGDLGMAEALKRWQPALGKFSLYASYWIRSKLQVAFVSNLFIRVNRNPHAYARRLKNYCMAKGLAPMDVDSANENIQLETGLLAEQIILARSILISNFSVISLNAQKDDGTDPLVDTLPSTLSLYDDTDDSHNPEQLCIRKQTNDRFAKMFTEALTNERTLLSFNERRVLRMLFVENHSPREVANALGYGRPNILAIVKTALPKLRRHFKDFQ